MYILKKTHQDYFGFHLGYTLLYFIKQAHFIHLEMGIAAAMHISRRMKMRLTARVVEGDCIV